MKFHPVTIDCEVAISDGGLFPRADSDALMCVALATDAFRLVIVVGGSMDQKEALVVDDERTLLRLVAVMLQQYSHVCSWSPFDVDYLLERAYVHGVSMTIANRVEIRCSTQHSKLYDAAVSIRKDDRRSLFNV